MDIEFADLKSVWLWAFHSTGRCLYGPTRNCVLCTIRAAGGV